MSRAKIRASSADGNSAYACYIPESQTHEITIPFHASTKTRLHEFAHCLNGDCLDQSEFILASALIQQEVDAEIYACEACGKSLSMETVENLAGYMIKKGCKVSFIFNTIKTSIKKHGYNLDHKQESWLWQSLISFWKQRRDSKAADGKQE